MKIYLHKLVPLSIFIIAFQLASCNKWESNYEKIEPAHLEHLENSELSKLTLTEKAVERIGVLTSTVVEENPQEGNYGEQSTQTSVPYGAILYDAQGRIWVYTNPEPQVYLRHEVKIDFIKDGKTYLLEGPPVGTKVVSQGAAELYGTEYEVGH